MNYIDQIAALNACGPAVDWLRQENHPTLEAAWAACPRGDWMLWLTGRVTTSAPWSDARKPLVKAANACAREALPNYEARYPGDTRIRACLDATDGWVEGRVSQEGLVVARRAAYIAFAYAVFVYADAVFAYADAATYAYAAAFAYADADAYASAAAAADAYAGGDSVREQNLKRSADIVRSILPCPILPELLA